jgi:predicted extracellular nuclease
MILTFVLTALPAHNVQAATPTELFFSEYIEGSSNNKAIEIYNGTGAAINLGTGGYTVQMFFNGSASAGLTINLTGSVAAGDVYVVAQSSANAAILAQADQTNGSGWFNGDDAVVLRKGTIVIDVIGQIGFDPGSEWGTGLTSTADNTLRRKDTICTGEPNGSDAFDPSAEWEGFATDTFGGLGSHTANCNAPDAAPVVTSSYPVDGATGIPLAADLSVTFSEPVNVNGAWYSLACSVSGAHTAVVNTTDNKVFTINPDTNFVGGETCTWTIENTLVSDQDSNDPPDTMSVDFVVGFTTFDVCAQPYTSIPAIQGSGATVALPGTRTTQGVVVGDYEGASPALRGFFIQDPVGDGDPATSDGIFVFEGSNANTVSLSDIVRITGTAGENQGQSQISVGTITKCGTGTVTPTDILFPVSAADFLEQYEGMLVRLPQTMYVTEHFQLGRFGQVVLSSGGKLKQPTNVVAPGAPALALQSANNLNKIILDDASQAQNPDPILFGRGGQPLSASNTLRGGDTATGIVGVLNYTWGGNAASGNAYRVRPVNALNGYVNFEPSNPRPSSVPEVGGTVRVVGMNLLNFFNTFSGCTNGVGGDPASCRGASNANEFDRQWVKTVAAIVAMNPDVVGFNEIENDGYGPTSAIQFLVDQLNAATAPGTYAFINADAATGQTNALGVDGIKVGMIYKPAIVTPWGQTAVLNSVAFVNGGDSAARNRPSLAQAFQVNTTGAVFIVNINHLKSKGSACDSADAGDGQGNCTQVRVNAAVELMNWFATDPTGTGDPDILMVGDYNSYAMEDPITAIKNAGFTNLIESFLGPDAYSYVFDGQWGYLDHALGSASLVGQVNGVGDYHINSDEPSVLDYLEDFKSAGQLVSLYAPDQFRISDHDPVMIGLTPNAPPTVDAGGSYSVNEGGSVALNAAGSDPNGDVLTYAWDLDNNGSFETAGQSVTFDATLLDGPSSYTVKVQASDPGGLSAEAVATVNVLNVAPSVTASFASGRVACGANNSTLTVNFSDPGVADTQTVVVNWGDGSTDTVNPASSPLSLTHTYTAAAAYTATVTVSDDDGGNNTVTATTAVNFNVSGFLPPINADGSSVFKYKSTIPVKIRITNCDGSTPTNLAPTISLTVLSGDNDGQVINEPISTSGADTTGIMRFSTNQYIYNLATKPLPDSSATYQITVTIPLNGQTVTVVFGLRP